MNVSDERWGQRSLRSRPVQRARPEAPYARLPRGRRHLRCCECGERTDHGKPYCTAHLLLHPYAAEVRAELARLGWVS